MSKIYYEGQLHSTETPVLTGTNSAFLYGQSVFSSSVVHNGKILFFEEHLKRTLAGIGEIFEVSEEEKIDLEKRVQKGITEILKNANEDDYFRLTFFWDDGLKFTLLLGAQGRPAEPVKAKSVIKLPRGEYIPEQVKVGNYVNELYLKKSVAREGYNDVLYVYNDRLLEFSTGNIFLISGKTLVTSRKQGIFSGIIRSKVITCAKEMGYTLEERDIDIREVSNFEYALLSNSVKLLLPVIKIDDKDFQPNNNLVNDFVEAIKSSGN